MKERIENIIDRFKNFRAYSSERAQYFSGEPEARYNFALRYSEGKKMLDVGCSLGCGTYYLACGGAKKAVGVDYSKAAIATAKKNYRLPNLNFFCLSAGDAEKLGTDFEAIVAFEIIEHLEADEAEKFLRGAAKILRPGGVFILSTPNKLVTSPGREKPFNPYHVKEYLPVEFSELLKKYFPDLELYGMKCANPDYLKIEQALAKESFRYKSLKYFGRSKTIRSFTAFVPMKYRQKITGEEKLPKMGVEDFEISASEINSASTLLAVCRSRPKARP